MANHGIRSAISFKGTAAILSEGPRFDEIIEFYKRRCSTTVKHHIVLVDRACGPADLASL